MANISHVSPGTVIASVRENQSTDEVNDSVKMGNTGTQRMTGTLVVNGRILTRGGSVAQDRDVIYRGGFGDVALSIVVCTQAQYDAATRLSTELYFIKG